MADFSCQRERGALCRSENEPVGDLVFARRAGAVSEGSWRIGRASVFGGEMAGAGYRRQPVGRPRLRMQRKCITHPDIHHVHRDVPFSRLAEVAWNKGRKSDSGDSVIGSHHVANCVFARQQSARLQPKNIYARGAGADAGTHPLDIHRSVARSHHRRYRLVPGWYPGVDRTVCADLNRRGTGGPAAAHLSPRTGVPE